MSAWCRAMTRAGVEVLALAGARELQQEIVVHVVLEVRVRVRALVFAAVVNVAPMPHARGHAT